MTLWHPWRPAARPMTPWWSAVALPLLVHLVCAWRLDASRIHHRNGADNDAGMKDAGIASAQLVGSTVRKRRSTPYCDDDDDDLPELEVEGEEACIPKPKPMEEALGTDGGTNTEKVAKTFYYGAPKGDSGHVTNGLGILQLDPDTLGNGGRIFSTATLGKSTAMLNWIWYQNEAKWPGTSPLFEKPIDFGGAIKLTTGYPEGGYKDITVNIGRSMKKGMEDDMLPECCRLRDCYCQWLPKNSIPPESQICVSENDHAVRLLSGHVYAYVGKKTNVNEAALNANGASLVTGENPECSFVDLTTYNWTSAMPAESLCRMLFPDRPHQWEDCSKMILCQTWNMATNMNFPVESKDKDDKTKPQTPDDLWFEQQAIAIPKMGQIETKLFTKSLSVAQHRAIKTCKQKEYQDDNDKTTPQPETDDNGQTPKVDEKKGSIEPPQKQNDQKSSSSASKPEVEKVWKESYDDWIHQKMECASKCDGKRGECDYCGARGLCCQDPGYGYWWTFTYYPDAIEEPCGTKGKEYCEDGGGSFCCVPSDSYQADKSQTTNAD